MAGVVTDFSDVTSNNNNREALVCACASSGLSANCGVFVAAN